MKVKFIDVGRDSRTWEAELPDKSVETLSEEASKALMSSDVCCTNGTVYAGFRPVGKYEITEEESE